MTLTRSLPFQALALELLVQEVSDIQQVLHKCFLCAQQCVSVDGFGKLALLNLCLPFQE